MLEKIVLTEPEPAITEWRLSRLVIDRDAAEVIVRLRANTGTTRDIYYRAASEWIDELTTADLSAESLDCRVLLRLVADGHLDGAVVSEDSEEEESES